MKTTVVKARAAIAAAAIMAASAAQATLVTTPYFATANVAGNFNSDEGAMVRQARADFLGQVVDVQTETLENIAAGDVVNRKIFNGAATVLPPLPPATGTTGKVTNIVTGSDGGLTGRFNTTQNCNQFTACNFVESSDSFAIDFGGNYSAFAFYGTDFSDFAGLVYIDLLERDQNGNLVAIANSRIPLSGPINSDALLRTNGTGDGSLLHFGFTDDARSYAGIQITVVQGTGGIVDYLGFDDLILANYKGTGGAVPEPATLALALVALAGATASRRKSAVRG